MRHVTLIASLLAACGSDDKPKPPPPPSDGIVVVTAGAAPQRALRYRLAANADTRLELAVDVDLKTPDLDVAVPTLVMGLDLAVTAIDADGTARVRLTVADAGARARGAEANPALAVMDRQAKHLTGAVVTLALAPTGEVRDTALAETDRDLSKPMADQMQTLLQTSEQLAMRLPDEPVGVGAVWTHRRTMKLAQLSLVSVTRVEVTAIDGDRITFRSTTELTGTDQLLVQDGATLPATDIRGTGSQHGTFDLASATLTGEANATLGFQIAPDGTPRRTQLDMVTRFAPRAP